ncbi:ATPase [Subdoligranulum sp. APC924/74]|jgi:predicted AAA+ superfamily ATPase|uniref:ATP-binding protein n=1 Tax=Subdoligranulum sp. APC924/74 TaxID=2086273 RepID=UPI000DE89E7D|nr:ATP-binding protein [Subdoligranulum sp. APC924/74]RCH46896.1 ATPase [Subdoligranulum sp. APC924/74]
MINRDSYLNRLVRHRWNGEIKVITGIRRCGKSVLLFDLFYEYLLSQGVADDHIIKIELDQRRFYKFRNPITLCEYVESVVQAKANEQFYLFIDEVQLTTKVVDKENGGIEVTIYDMLNELKAYKNLDVYVTGSNSKGLSKDIATEFRGRATQIHVFPLSFAEFYSYVGGDERKALDTYMLYGGMPRLLMLEDEKDKKDYLASLYSELYVKDIVERNKIEREDILNDILDFLASQISSLTNPNNIANAIASMKKEKVNPTLVSNYVQFIMDSFLISMAKRYDVKGKTYFNYPNKYYYTDVGLRNARLNYRQYDPGHIMENIIYNELLQRGYSVDVGVVYDRTNGGKTQKEIDFVVNDADKKIYIQSAFRMDTEKKESAELLSLLLAKDFFKKIIVRMDIPHSFYDENGVFHCNFIDLLLGRVELF